jgi:hypothetical protein
MEETYKQHVIRAGAAAVRDRNEWKPIAQVNWYEDGKDRVRLWMEWQFRRAFATEKEAETEAELSAKKWIDGKT